MPIFTPGRRWQPPFNSFGKQSPSQGVLVALEKFVKGPLWGCRMCGNCILQETAFICAMECPKGIRNGPCGGSTSENCYVDNSRPCIWYQIYDRAFRMSRQELLLEVLPPLDWEKVGGETWGDVIAQIRKNGTSKVLHGLVNRDAAIRVKTWDGIFRPVRQPDWWNGDSEYHAPKYGESISNLERRLRAGEFVITAEVQPPQTVSTNKLLKNLQMVKPYVTAVNFTDNPSATPRMSSWACSCIAIHSELEPVMQIVARDRTRIGLQADVIGANALGVRNILCLSGDSMKLSPGPRGRMDIVDIDSIQMLWILRRMRDDGRYLDGRELKFPPKLFLGAAASPFASEPEFQAIREHKKVNAGAQFFQTNLVYDTDRLEIWLNELVKRNILDKVFILIGITPLKSLKMANYLNNEVPGVVVPLSILKRMEAAESAGNAQEEGVQITLELIEKLQGKQGINGLHIMAVGWEDIVPRIVSEAHLISYYPQEAR